MSTYLILHVISCWHNGGSAFELIRQGLVIHVPPTHRWSYLNSIIRLTIFRPAPSKNQWQKDMLPVHMITFHFVSSIHFLSTPHHKHYHDTSLTHPNSLILDQNIYRVHVISYPTFIPPLIPTIPTILYKQQLPVQKRFAQTQSNVNSLFEWLIYRHSSKWQHVPKTTMTFFSVILSSCFYGCYWMGELVLNNDLSLWDWCKIIRRAFLHFTSGCAGYHLPYHKRDCFF